jgi:succinate dehydrogenase / fumarate reductase flavoprotein subunit
MDPDDTSLIHAVDTYSEAQYIANPHLVEILADNAPSAIDDLLRWGANFHTESDGSLTQRFFGAHTYRRTCFSGDETGLEMIRTLTKRSYELDIPYLECIYVYQLLVNN